MIRPRIFRLALALSLSLLSGMASAADIKMKLSCQQNLSDGRILVDGTMLPAGARYKVLNYNPQRSEGAWSYGQCLLNVTKGVSD